MIFYHRLCLQPHARGGETVFLRLPNSHSPQLDNPWPRQFRAALGVGAPGDFTGLRRTTSPDNPIRAAAKGAPAFSPSWGHVIGRRSEAQDKGPELTPAQLAALVRKSVELRRSRWNPHLCNCRYVLSIRERHLPLTIVILDGNGLSRVTNAHHLPNCEATLGCLVARTGKWFGRSCGSLVPYRRVGKTGESRFFGRGRT
jgi:hypothetical protein